MSLANSAMQHETPSYLDALDLVSLRAALSDSKWGQKPFATVRICCRAASASLSLWNSLVLVRTRSVFMHSTVLFVIAAALVSAAVPVSSFETCSDADNEQLNDLYSAAAETSACAPYSTFMPIGTAAIYWPCDATDCQEVMAQVASDMPDCWYMGNNQKETLQEAIDRCAGETPDWTTTGSSDGGEDSAVTSEPSSSPSSEATDNEATTTAPEPEQENTGSTAASDAPATTAPVGDSTLTSTASTLVGAALCWSLIGMVAHA